MLERAYSLLEVKAVDDEARIIEGIASTPTPDRMGDIVEPMGAKFALPMPLLWQHDSGQPIGQVEFAQPTKAGIPFKARLARIDEPGILKDRLDEAWQSIKAGLVRAVSIGFRALEYNRMEDGGLRFVEWEWLELSAVTIPANADATINIVRSIDSRVRAASGQQHDGVDRRVPPGAAGHTKAIKAITPTAPKEGTPMKTIAEQISAFEATRQAKAARMAEIMSTAADAGVTLDQAQAEEYDTLEGEVKSIDDHLKRLDSQKAINVAKAAPVDGTSSARGSESRGGPVIQVRNKDLPKGTGFTRYAMALARSKGNLMQALEIAKSNEQWMAETPDLETILRAAVAAGTTTDATWAAPLVQYQNLASEFIEFLRPLTIIGRLSLRNVPFKVKLPRQTGASSVNWVGEGKVKPVSSLAFDSITLDFAKLAGIVVLTDELVRLSSPAAEGIVRQDLADSIVQFMDSQFVDPTKGADDVSPASITNGVSPVAASGTNLAALQADVQSLMLQFVDSNLSLADGAWIMTQQQALSIGMMRNALGQKAYPELSVNGGTFEGLPAIVSENIPGTGGSPTDGYPLILLKQGDVLLADDGDVTLDASREASLQMDSTPDSPATGATTLVSLWQHNMVGIRAERMVNWKKRRAEAVGYIANAKYRA